MKALYTGICHGKGDTIRRGDEIARDRIGWSHLEHVGLLPESPKISHMDQYRAQFEREKRAYDDEVARLSPELRQRWLTVLRDMEYFDGEWGIALAQLRMMKASGRLAKYVSRYPDFAL